MHPVEQHYRERRELAKTMPAEEKDFWALDQSKASSLTRYRVIAENVKGLDGRVVDLACGTGAMLDTFVDLGLRPEFYLGVDGLAEHRADVDERLRLHGIDGAFVHKPMTMRFESFPLGARTVGADAAVCTGLMGFWGYHSQRHVRSLYDYMRALAPHGGIMVPMAWNHQNLGDAYIRRWPLGDVTDLLGLSDRDVVVLTREFLVCW